VNAAVAGGALYFDFTGGAFGPDPLTTAIYTYDGRIQNLGSTKTSGLDFTLDYERDLTVGTLLTRFDISYIDRFDVRLTPSSSEVGQIDSVGNPASFRARGMVTWLNGGFTGSLAGNYVSGYDDTSSLTPRDVDAFVTFDATLRYDLENTSGLGRAYVSASLLNMFDEDPPFVESGALSFPGSHYDPANASPQGRFLVVSVGTRW